MSARDGGPAFPRPDVTGIEDQRLWESGHAGMSLRDWFAGQAPEAPLEWRCSIEHPDEPGGAFVDGEYAAAMEQYRDAKAAWAVRRVVEWRWAYADAMLKAREGR